MALMNLEELTRLTTESMPGVVTGVMTCLLIQLVQSRALDPEDLGNFETMLSELREQIPEDTEPVVRAVMEDFYRGIENAVRAILETLAEEPAD